MHTTLKHLCAVSGIQVCDIKKDLCGSGCSNLRHPVFIQGVIALTPLSEPGTGSTYTVGAKENIQFFLRIFVINMSWKDQYIRWHVLQGQRLIFLSYPVEDVLKFRLFLFQTFKQSTSCAVILIKCSSKSGLHTPLCTVQLLACCTG